MKFAEKYEIQELLTSGRVSTFLARERTTQDPVVVYTFECAGTGAGDLSTASIISRFCGLAPNPPGMIIKAGFDEASSSAFIATKMPDSAALKDWVRAYQAFGKPEAAPTAPMPAANSGVGPSDETAEISAEELRSYLAKSAPTAKKPAPPQSLPQSPIDEFIEDLGGKTAAFSIPPASKQSSGEFTRLFREVGAFQPVPQIGEAPAAPEPTNTTDAIPGHRLGSSPLGGERTAVPPTPPPAAPPEPSPGSFTREFLGLSAEKVEPAPKPAPAPPPPPVESPGSFTREFLGLSSAGSEFTPTQTAPPTPPPAQKEPGAFTKEFLAYSPPAESSTPKTVQPPNPPAAPADSSSTALFGNIFGPPSPSKPASPAGNFASEPPAQKDAPGEFTSFFRDPFEHPQAASKSIEIPDFGSNAAPRQPTGEFTRMFGRDEVEAASTNPLPSPEPEPRPASGSFTQIFGDASSGRPSQLGASTLDTNPNVRPSFLEPAPPPPASPEPPRPVFSAPPASAPPDPFFARTPAPPSPPANQPFMNRPGSSEATDVFRLPTAEAPPVEQAPGGPSEFTMFLSRSQLNASLQGQAPAPPAPPANPAGGVQLPTFAPPAAPPNPFQFAPPPQPLAPPAMKYPPMPAMPAAPVLAPPPVPAPSVAAPKPGSILPLIAVFAVLLAIGVILVMYFALKH